MNFCKNLILFDFDNSTKTLLFLTKYITQNIWKLKRFIKTMI